MDINIDTEFNIFTFIYKIFIMFFIIELNCIKRAILIFLYGPVQYDLLEKSFKLFRHFASVLYIVSAFDEFLREFHFRLYNIHFRSVAM